MRYGANIRETLPNDFLQCSDCGMAARRWASIWNCSDFEDAITCRGAMPMKFWGISATNNEVKCQGSVFTKHEIMNKLKHASGKDSETIKHEYPTVSWLTGHRMDDHDENPYTPWVEVDDGGNEIQGTLGTREKFWEEAQSMCSVCRVRPSSRKGGLYCCAGCEAFQNGPLQSCNKEDVHHDCACDTRTNAYARFRLCTLSDNPWPSPDKDLTMFFKGIYKELEAVTRAKVITQPRVKRWGNLGGTSRSRSPTPNTRSKKTRAPEPAPKSVFHVNENDLATIRVDPLAFKKCQNAVREWWKGPKDKDMSVIKQAQDYVDPGAFPHAGWWYFVTNHPCVLCKVQQIQQGGHGEPEGCATVVLLH